MNLALDWLRSRMHPLWRLRRLRGYRWLQARCDFAVPRRQGRVFAYSYLLRDLARVDPRMCGEPRTCALFTETIDRCGCDCFVDVGANVGAYSWIVANRRPSARLMLFEPDPSNVRLLRKSIARSRLSNAELYAVALADRRGKAPFLVDEVSGAIGSLLGQAGGVERLRDSYGLTRCTTVETRRLDEFADSFTGSRVAMKVDVEGAESLVFAGAARVLSEIRPVVFCESFGGSGLSPLRSAGYRTFSVCENSNYLALPGELASLAEGLDLVEARAGDEP